MALKRARTKRGWQWTPMATKSRRESNCHMVWSLRGTQGACMERVLVASQGFEPQYAESESAVLPLNDEATGLERAANLSPRSPRGAGPTPATHSSYEELAGWVNAAHFPITSVAGARRIPRKRTRSAQCLSSLYIFPTRSLLTAMQNRH